MARSGFGGTARRNVCECCTCERLSEAWCVHAPCPLKAYRIKDLIFVVPVASCLVDVGGALLGMLGRRGH